MNEQQLFDLIRIGAKFAVGDKVIGNEGAVRYFITNTGWVGNVVKVRGKSEIWVQGKYSEHEYPVDPANFDHYERNDT